MPARTRTSPRRPPSTRRVRGGRRPGFLLRPARPSDLDALVAHRRAMWVDIGRGTPAELDRHDRVYRRWLLKEREAGRFFGFVAEEPGGRVLGSGAVWLMPAQPRPTLRPRRNAPYILSMYTEPYARGRGVASAIVSRALAWAKARGYPRISLHASPRGRGVYERLGFASTNEMRLDLAARRGRSKRGGTR